jgi:predicted dehydrogenase
MGQNLAECLDLAKTIKTNKDLAFLVGYCYRFHPVYLQVKEAIPNPTMTYCQVMGKRETPGTQYLYHNLCHTVDMICWLHDSEPKAVHAWATMSSGDVDKREVSEMDRWVVTLRFENGSIATIGIGGDAAGGFLPKWYFKVCGPAGVTAEVINNTDVYIAPDESKSLREANYYEGHIEEMRVLVDAASGGNPPRVTLSDAIRANAILELVEESATKGSAVQFDKSVLPEAR